MDLKNDITDTSKENANKQLHTLSMKMDSNKNRVYNQWAESYDDYVNKFEYSGPRELVRLINLYKCHFEGNKISVLDFGCGTGLLAEAFCLFNGDASSDHNVNNIIGVDISEKMLEKSRVRNIYSKLSCLDITHEDEAKDVIDKLSAPSDGFDLVMSCGVFLEGHVSLAEINRMLLKLVKKGGVLAFTVRQSFMESEENFMVDLLQRCDVTILAKARINYLKGVEAWAIILKRL
jgi:predicted TPR repeat methyltransferase